MGDTGCPEDWPDALREMRTLDNLLRCPICCELINTAMLVPKCSHTYCSLCIRRYSCMKSKCPTCSSAVSEPELLNNRVVDEIVSLFQQVRPALLEVVNGALKKGVEIPEIKKSTVTKTDTGNDSKHSLSGLEFQEGEEAKKNIHSMSTKRSGRPFGIFSPKGHSSKRKFEFNEFDDDFDDVIVCDGPAEVKKLRTDDSETFPSEPCTPSINKHQWSVNNSTMTPKAGSSSSSSSIFSPGSVATPTGRKPLDFQSPPFAANSPLPGTPMLQTPLNCTQMSQTPSSANKVPCPVCQAEIPERNINIHLDRCLSGSEKKEGLRSSKRKLMPKLVYNLIKDGELRKKLSAVGLPTTGDRQTMINRHKEFALIYNSECDSLTPRTAEEIVRDMLKSEQSKLKQATINPVTTLQIKKGATSDEVEKAQKDYVKKHKSQFAQLIAETKMRMKAKQKSSSSQPKPASSDVETGCSTEPVAETAGTSSGSSSNQDNIPVLLLQDISSTIPYEDDSSHGSSELFCDLTSAKVSKDCDQNELPRENSEVLNLPHIYEDSSSSDKSEILLSLAPAKAPELNLANTDALMPSIPKVTPIDFDDPISVSSQGIPNDVLSQISDSIEIPLTQASKSSKVGGVNSSGLIGEDKSLESASQKSAVSFASSESSRLTDNLSDYTPDIEELHHSDNGEVPKKKERPKRKAQMKKKTSESAVMAEKPQRKTRPRSSLLERVTPSQTENIDTNNLIDDPDFADKPIRRLRTKKSKA